MSNYKYFSKMYTLVRVIALLFHCPLCLAELARMRAAAGIQNQVGEV